MNFIYLLKYNSILASAEKGSGRSYFNNWVFLVTIYRGNSYEYFQITRYFKPLRCFLPITTSWIQPSDIFLVRGIATPQTRPSSPHKQTGVNQANKSISNFRSYLDLRLGLPYWFLLTSNDRVLYHFCLYLLTR